MGSSLSVEEVRRRIAALATEDRCHPQCPTYEVFETAHGNALQTCDECWYYTPASDAVSDRDIESLPEAQELLRRANTEGV